MKVWVTGAAGMLGKEIVSQLKTPHIGTDKKQGNITENHERFIVEHGITHIINCAAYTAVDPAESDRENAFLINAAGVHNLGRLSKKYQLPIIHFSTDYVFDGAKTSPYEENEPTNPLNVYGLSKRAGEKLLLEETPHACVIRTSWLFGPYGKNFVHTMLKLMQEKETLSVVSNQIGRPTYTKDLAAFALQMFDQRGIYHFANSGETSWFSFASEIHNMASIPFKVKEITPTLSYKTAAVNTPYSALSTQKIENQFHIKPRSWQNALKEYLSCDLLKTF